MLKGNINPIKVLSVLEIKPKDFFERKLWCEFPRSYLCIENWRNLCQKMA
jgi:hypothetical protein